MLVKFWKHIFIILFLFGIIFLLRNITYENWTIYSMSTLPKFLNWNQNQSSRLPGRHPLFHHNRTFCPHFGQPPSREEEMEEQVLLDSIEWPLLPSGYARPSLSQTSDPAHSLFKIISKIDQRWYVGDHLEVLVHLHDFKGRPKRYGGDFLLARLYSQEHGAAVVGQVLDHKDGLYTVRFPLLWEGSAQVEVIMVHSSEAINVLHRLREKRPDRVFFGSLFRRGKKTKKTACGMCLPQDQGALCNYTDLHSGEPWYCYKPKKLGCDNRINHYKGGYLKNVINKEEALLFQSGVNVKVPIHSSSRDTIDVLPSKTEMKDFSLKTQQNVGPRIAVDSTHDILLTYRCHGPPIRFTNVLASELRYIANELDGLAGGPHTVVAMSIWSHFSTFPVEVYIRRLRHIRKAVVRLLGRAPGTLVVVRTGNPQALERDASLYNSDWFSIQLDVVLRAMFKDLDVILVDAWQMCVAHGQPHNIHPPPAIVKNMVDLMLSNICHD
ncbi:NXPE family member 3-like [Corythoichthys intestinalis]|uniref:NXPE family member 3-like n=1 Tax=Corythoichthys intestinalis TaxID=161448 RepID=UPI0025A605BE|nr:NXPE family member 3-like [Corythoichthys intestinalis]